MSDTIPTLIPVTELKTDDLINEADGMLYNGTINSTIAYGMGVVDAISMRKRSPRSILLFIAAVELGSQAAPDFESARELVDGQSTIDVHTHRSASQAVDDMYLEAYAEGWERSL